MPSPLPTRLHPLPCLIPQHPKGGQTECQEEKLEYEVELGVQVRSSRGTAKGRPRRVAIAGIGTSTAFTHSKLIILHTLLAIDHL